MKKMNKNNISKKFKMFVSSNKLKIFIFFLIVGIITIGVTIAYFYRIETLPNQFKTMVYDIDVTEEFNNTWGTKKVFISNNDNSNTPVLLRINYNEIWQKEVDGAVLVISNIVNGSNVVNKNWTETFLNDFIDGHDGWYYYKKILNPKDSIQILNSIELNQELIQLSADYSKYLDYNYNLIFNYEAIDVNVNSVRNIWNKNIIIDDINVSWT